MAGTFCPRSVAGSGYFGTAAVCPTRRSRCTCSTATRATFYSPRGRPAHTPPRDTLDSQTHSSLKGYTRISMATREVFYNPRGRPVHTSLLGTMDNQTNSSLKGVCTSMVTWRTFYRTHSSSSYSGQTDGRYFSNKELVKRDRPRHGHQG